MVIGVIAWVKEFTRSRKLREGLEIGKRDEEEALQAGSFLLCAHL